MTSYPRMELDEARQWLAAAVATQGPGFIYNVDIEEENRSCSYFIQPDAPEGDPARLTPCLIGVAIRLAGREVLPEMEGNTCDTDWVRDAWNLSYPAARYLWEAQSAQDRGCTWGQSFNRAETFALECKIREEFAERTRVSLSTPA